MPTAQLSTVFYYTHTKADPQLVGVLKNALSICALHEFQLAESSKWQTFYLIANKVWEHQKRIKFGALI